MNKICRYVLGALAGLAGTLMIPMAYAQLNSSAATVQLNASLPERLTITATPSIVNFSLTSGGVASGSAPIAISTNWLAMASRSTIGLYAWFATPTAALTDGATIPNNITSSEVFGQVTTGIPTSFASFVQTATLGSAVGGLKLFTQTVSTANRASSRTDNLNLQIDLSDQPSLPAGSYTGTLNLQAQAL